MKTRIFENTTALILVTFASISLAAGLVLPAARLTPTLGDVLYDALWGLKSEAKSILMFVEYLIDSDDPREVYLGYILGAFSIVFPVGKLVVLYAELLVPNRWTRGVGKLAATIGYWSMLDVFVISVLVASLKDFPGGTEIVPLWGTVFFATSVILTMIASFVVHRVSQTESRENGSSRDPNQHIHTGSTKGRVARGTVQTSLLLALLLTISTSSGCRFFGAIDRVSTTAELAVEKIDDMIHELREARQGLSIGADDVRKSLDDLADKMKDGGADLISNELRDFVDLSFAHAGMEFRCNVDYAERKIDENLRAIIEALEKKRLELKNGGDLRGSVEDVIGSITYEMTPMPPFICMPVPNAVRLEVDPGSGGLRPRKNADKIEYTGFGLRASSTDDFRPTLVLQSENKDGKLEERPIENAESAINKTSNYALQINLQPLASQFGPDDVKLVLRYGDRAGYELPMIQPHPDDRPMDKVIDLLADGKMSVKPAHVTSVKYFPIYMGDVIFPSAQEFEEQTTSYLHQSTGFPHKRYVRKSERNLILDGLRGTLVEKHGRWLQTITIPEGGDREFAGQGPIVTVELSLAIAPDCRSIVATANMWAAEWKHQMVYRDYTYGFGTVAQSIRLPASRDDFDIVEIKSKTAWTKTTVIHGHRKFEDSFLQGELLSEIEITGDSSGDDIGVKTKAVFDLNPIRVRIAKQGQHPTSPGPQDEVAVRTLN